jgi:hypothetical protein
VPRRPMASSDISARMIASARDARLRASWRPWPAFVVGWLQPRPSGPLESRGQGPVEFEALRGPLLPKKRPRLEGRGCKRKAAGDRFLSRADRR